MTETRSPVVAEIHIDSTLDSSHRLPFVPESHRCSKPHGHTFSVRLFAKGEVVETGGFATGMVSDYDDVLAVWTPLHEQLDHRVLNDVPGLDNPTCENLAIWILERTPAWITAVEIGTGLVGGMRAACRIDREILRRVGSSPYESAFVNVPSKV